MVGRRGDPDGDGKGITGTFFGTHAIVADFDGDGLLDVLWFSETEPGGDSAEREWMLVYGQSEVIHPLTLGGPTPGPELDRIKFFPNGSGSWFKGHRAWRAAVADFNLDGYPDLLTLTASGVQLHANHGARGYQSVPPHLDQRSDTTPHMVGPLTFEAAVAPPPMGSINVGIEALEHGATGVCTYRTYYPPVTKYNETDPKKPPGALQLAMREFSGSLYHFEELSDTEVRSGPCVNRLWDWTGIDRKTKAVVSGTVAALSRERALIDIRELEDLDGDPTKVERH